MCPATTGTQTVGSIGRPAAYCGVVGFVPTQSRVSRAGVFPVSWSLDHIGGFTHSAADARMFLEALSGVTIPVVQAQKPIRVGVLRQFFAVKADPEILKLHDTVLKRLDPHVFVRVHRAAIVNVDEVREARDAERLVLVLSNGAQVPVSRSRRRQVEPIVLPRLH